MIEAMPFDFDAAVVAPFRMQPGLRRMAAGSPHLVPQPPDSRHQREKLAVLSAFSPDALCVHSGFDARAAVQALTAHAAVEHPQAWAWDGERARALALATSVTLDGRVEQSGHAGYGVGDEAARCLLALPADWRLPALLSLSFAEDFAIIDATTGTIPWLAVALPSHWAPREKVGRHFSQVHAPVADNDMLLKAGDSLMRMVSAGQRWERFVWTVTDHPRLHAHPARSTTTRWQGQAVEAAWWRTEHQTFIPLPGLHQAVFTIAVDVQPLALAIDTPRKAAALQAAIGSMSASVLAYRGLSPVREPLLAWLASLASRP